MNDWPGLVKSKEGIPPISLKQLLPMFEGTRHSDTLLLGGVADRASLLRSEPFWDLSPAAPAARGPEAAEFCDQNR